MGRRGMRYPATGADADTALVEEIAVTPANINDGKAGPDALPENPGDVYADSAYRGDHFGTAVIAKGGARLEAWNKPIQRIRGRIEKIVATAG